MTEKFAVEAVTCKYGMTLNLGNYESFRADAEATIVAKKDCATEAEAEILKDEMFEYGWNIVKDQLKKQVQAVRQNTTKKESKYGWNVVKEHHKEGE